MTDILIPEETLETEEDRFGFRIFVKALHAMLRLSEGIVIEDNGKLYIVNKFYNEDTKEEMIGIDTAPKFSNEGKEISHGNMVWLEKSEEEIPEVLH